MVHEVTRLPNDRTGLRCNWGAITLGATFTLALVALILLVANGIGLGPAQVLEPEASGAERWGGWLYTWLCVTAAFGAGGWACVRMGGIRDLRAGTEYGLASWALSGVLILLFASGRSLSFRLLLTGDGPAAVNWLLIAIAVTGAAAAALGGRRAGTTRVAERGERPALAA